jgi:serine/threonine-protein kinase RsbW
MNEVLAQFSVSADPANVAQAVEAVVRLAAAAGVPHERVARLEVAVEEWIVNLCRYAYAEPGGTIAVAVRKAPAEISVEICDQGRAFDPTTVPDPDVTAPLAQRQAGGLGLLLIRRLADRVGYRRDGSRNILTLTLRVDQS